MFGSHGKFIVTRKANILEVDATGPFNQAAVNCYQSDLLTLVTEIKGGWGQIVYMHENCLYTPGAEQQMYSFTKMRKDLGLQAIALVFVDNNTMQIIKDKVADFYQSLAVTYHFFTDKSQAKEWLDKQLTPLVKPTQALSTDTYDLNTQLVCQL